MQASSEPCMFRMHDGRSFTDYRPRCMVQQSLNNIKQPNGVVANKSYETRMFLMNNAEKMMEANRKHFPCNMKSCNSTHLTPLDKNTVQCNAHSCTMKPTNQPGGIGTGRNYTPY